MFLFSVPHSKVKRAIIFAGILGATAISFVPPGPARADSLSIGAHTSNLNLGINIGPTPPPLVVAPGPVVTGPPGPPSPPVCTAAGPPYNYFVYSVR